MHTYSCSYLNKNKKYQGLDINMTLWNDQIKVPLIASFQKRKILYNLVYNLEYTLSTFDIEEITFFILIKTVI